MWFATLQLNIMTPHHAVIHVSRENRSLAFSATLAFFSFSFIKIILLKVHQVHFSPQSLPGRAVLLSKLGPTMEFQAPRGFLQSKEHGPGVLDGPLDGLEEGDCLAAVHQAMVVRQRDEHHRTDHHLKDSFIPLSQIMHSTAPGCQLNFFCVFAFPKFGMSV